MTEIHWLLGLAVGLSGGIPIGLLLARMLDLLTRSVDVRRH